MGSRTTRGQLADLPDAKERGRAVIVHHDVAEVFVREGYVSGLRILDPNAASEIRRQFDALEAVEGRERCQIGLLDRHFDQRFVWDLAVHPVILDSIEA